MTTLGKYELHEQLGKGGFGTVYRATDTTLGREVALKILHPQLMVDEEFISRFKREARTLASLDNHHIVTIYEIGEEDGRIFIAMRYLPGGSLKQRIQKNGLIPFDQALSILQQVCNGLSEAHAKEMVHRDIKPENILFDAHGEAVVTDFGLVKAASSSGTSTSGVMIGTPAYIAPEIWSGKPATSATDVYALACVFYEMLTGKVLHQGESTPEVMKKHFDPLELPETWPTSVPTGINQVMERALAKDHQERFERAVELPTALSKLEAQAVEPALDIQTRPVVSSRAKPVSVASPAEKLVTQEPRKGARWVFPLVLAAIALVVLVIGVSTGWFGLTGKATEVPTEVPVVTEAPVEPVVIALWTTEGEADGGLQYVTSLTDAFTAANPLVTFEVVNKEVETLREHFQTSSLAGNAPDLLWTVSDHAGPFTIAGLIQPVDELFDMTKYVASVEMNGSTWAVPISSGNHLVLLYNKSLVPTPPATTDEFVTVAKTLTMGEVYGFAYNQTVSLWAAPWLGGFGGKVFADDGVTPSLDTPEMLATMQFLYDLKFTHKVTPLESDYNSAETLFKEGKAAMFINGDWSLAGYQEALGENFGVAPIPQVSATGIWPAPYTFGTYFMIPAGLEGAKLEAVKAFVEFATNLENQTAQVINLKRLPGLKEALTIPEIVNDPILKASSEQMSYGTPIPTVVEMRCIWDAWTPELNNMLASANGTSPRIAVTNMQRDATACIANMH